MEEHENINDLLHSINNPPKADGEDDVAMAEEEDAPTKDPSKVTGESPISSPVKKKKKQSSTSSTDTSKASGDKTSEAKEAEKEKRHKANSDAKTKASAQPASVLKTGKLGSGSCLSFADEAPKKEKHTITNTRM